MHQYIPDVVITNPNYLVGIEGGQLVRVPCGKSQTGRTTSNTVTVLVGYQNAPDGSASFAGGFTHTNTASFTVTPSGSGTIALSPSGGGGVVIQPATGNLTLGPVATGITSITRIGNLAPISADSSGTPGNQTVGSGVIAGQCAMAPAGTQVVVTCPVCTTASKVFAILQQSDTTLTQILRVVPAAGSFTIVGNAAATAATKIGWFVVG